MSAAPSRQLAALLAILALGAVCAWAVAGSVTLVAGAHDSASTLHTLVVDRDLDLFAESGALALDAGPHATPASAPWVPGALPWLPAYALAHVASFASGTFAPEGVNPLYGTLIALTGLGLVVLGLARLARRAVAEGARPEAAALAAAVVFGATPLGWLALWAPGQPELVAGAMACLLVTARSRAARVALATVATAADLHAAVWLAYALIAPPAPADSDDPEPPDGVTDWLAVLALAAALAAPQLLVWSRRDGGAGPGLAALGRDLAGVHPAGFGAGSLRLALEVLIQHPLAVLAALGLALRGGARELSAAAITAALAFALAAGHPLETWTTAPASRLLATLAPLVYAGLLTLGAAGARAGAPRATTAAALALIACGLAATTRHRIETPHIPPALVMTEAGWSPVLLLTGGAVASLAALGLSAPAPRLGVVVLCGGGLALGGLGLVAATRPHGSIHACVWSAGPDFVDRGRPAQRWHPPAGTRADVLDIVTALDPAEQLTAGDLVALITVVDAQGRELDYPIEWAIDTLTEWAGDPARLIAPGPVAESRAGYRLLQTRVARHAPAGVLLRRVSLGQAYRKSCPFPGSLEVAEIRIQQRNATARLEIQGLWLGAKRPR